MTQRDKEDADDVLAIVGSIIFVIAAIAVAAWGF